MSRPFADFAVGEEYISQRRYLTETDVVQYSYLSGETAALLREPGDPRAALSVPDLLTLILQMGLGSKAIQPPMQTLALLGVRWQVHGRAEVGELMHVRTVLADKSVTSKGLGKLVWRREIMAGDRLVQTGELVNLVRNGAS